MESSSEEDDDYWTVAETVKQRYATQDSDRECGPDGRVLPNAAELEASGFWDSGDESEAHDVMTCSEYEDVEQEYETDSSDMSSEGESESDDNDTQEGARAAPLQKTQPSVGPQIITRRHDGYDGDTPVDSDSSVGSVVDARAKRTPVHSSDAERERYKQFWSRFRTDKDEAHQRMLDLNQTQEEIAAARAKQTKGRIIAPTERLYVEDTFCADFDPLRGVFCDNANEKLWQMLNCDPNGFIALEDQFTTLRGPLETLDRVAIDLTMKHVIAENQVDEEVRDFEDAQSLADRYAQCNPSHDLSQFEKHARVIDLHKERLQTLTSKYASLVPANAQQEFVPVKSPFLERMDQIRAARLKRDGLSDIVDAMVNCPICEFDCATNTTSDVASPQVIKLHAYWSEVCTMRNKEVVWRKMAQMWNENFVDPHKDQRSAPVPRLTPSHMDIHFSECDPTNIVPALVEDEMVLREAKRCARDNGVFTGQHVSGRPTGKLSLSKTGCKTFLDLNRQWRQTQEQIANYAANTRLVQGTFVAPLPAMFCQKRRLGLKSIIELTPRKNETIEEASTRAARAMLGDGTR